MRVALVCGDHRSERDGVAGYAHRLAEGLARHGVDVVLPPAPARWGLRGVARAGLALRDVDVAHLHFAPSAFGWRWEIGLLPARPLVVTLHEYDASLRAPRLLVPRAAAVVATNPGHAGAIRARFPAARVIEVPIGANLPPGDPGPARQGGPLLVFFGFVHAVKGIRHLIEAVALLRRDRPELRLALVGGFESLALRGREAVAYRAEVERMVAAAGLHGSVTITGWQPPEMVSRWLQAADVAVLPFTAGTTTKSGALLACAEHGLPLVATVADPPDPVLVDGETALLVPVRDGAALAKAVARVLEDPDLAGALGRAARRMAAAHSWDRIAADHLRLYRQVLA